MSVFIVVQDYDLFQCNCLDSFDVLWVLQLDVVDELNIEWGGWSSVYCFDLGDFVYYLKCQSNYLICSLCYLLGELIFVCEFCNIECYWVLGIFVLQVVFFVQQVVGGECQVIFLICVLDGWQDLDIWLVFWYDLVEEWCWVIFWVVGRLVCQLYVVGQMYGCFYFKYVFFCEGVDGVFEVCLIDLEKICLIWFGCCDQVKDLELMLCCVLDWSEVDVYEFIFVYVDEFFDLVEVEQWYCFFDQCCWCKELC